MDDFNTELWLQYHYPLTIISDRYDGTYSKGKYTALPYYYWQIPDDGPDGSDVDCMMFWKHFDGFCGLGNTPEEAVKHLIECIKDNKKYNNENVR